MSQKGKSKPRGSLEQRFWPKVDRWDPDHCWEWLGGHTSGGYSRLRGEDGRGRYAHRVAYELLVGPIPEGLQIDHLCRRPGCVNPKHLEPVTGRVNTLRGATITAANSRRTHCKRGHEFSEENTYRTRDGRSCRTCQRYHSRQHYRRSHPTALLRLAELGEDQ